MQRSTRSLILELILAAFFALGAALAQIAPQKPGASTDQQSRLALMKSRGTEGSLTILPVTILGQPMGPLSELIGLFLEQKGLKTIAIGQTPFSVDETAGMDKLSGSLGEFVAKNTITTEYALYAAFKGTPQTGVEEIQTVVVDKNGGVVWTDDVSAKDEAFKSVEPHPMAYCIFMTGRLAPQFGLNEETARAAKPGTMAQLMNERSGIPPENEMSALPQRMKEMRGARKSLTLRVFPVRRAGTTDVAGGTELAKMITDAGVCTALPAKEALLLKAAPSGPNEMKFLWDLAREFREHARGISPKTEYTLYADYGFNPEDWQQGYVHFVVCDPQGEWVLANLANSHHPDYQTIQPTSVGKCNALLLSRLQSALKWQVADAVKEAIESSGIDAARKEFDALRAKQDEYNVSEGEMNELGYGYLRAQKVKEAIAVFAMNVDAFPQSFNVYDSLGEAYAAAGEKELAIKNYEKSVALNPKNQGGIDALKKLKGR